MLAGLLCATEVAGGYETVLGLPRAGLEQGHHGCRKPVLPFAGRAADLGDPPAGAAGTAEALPGAAAGTQTLPAVRTSLQRITVSSAGANSWNN